MQHAPVIVAMTNRMRSTDSNKNAVKIDIMITRIVLNHCVCAFILGLTLLLQGCSTAPARQFVDIVEPDPNKGDVYLYRGDALFAARAFFTVSVDGQEIGDLFNASYLVIRLTPGSHSLSVSPTVISKTSELSIFVKQGETIFYEYDFVTGPLANTLFIGSSIEPRERSFALENMKELTGPGESGIIDVKISSPFAEIDNIDAVPLIDERGKNGYRDWLRKQTPRAFAIAAKGKWYATWGLSPNDPSDPKNPADRALKNCNKRGHKNCKLYAVNNRVVWQQ